ncbi:formimidoylglutamase [Pedobacter caeni]|uniref:Formiminoglutamase n=1 Tax=Pedobacter caeni TaxID=288992 RepID=A0A1M5MEI9_9SPHI|nr:formimidoylglutamase [Pedobacter caeni]SHG75778.1 formiminoglutamase [Pedobacter caeni]
MEGLNIYGKDEIMALTSQREGETKLGEKVQVISALDQLKSSPARFVLLGIPEDIGVRANHGIGGTATAWQPALKAILNTQSTSFLTGQELLVLGHFSFPDPAETDIKSLEDAVVQIDEQVYPVIREIVEAGKVPIVIGGGHNNAYPMIKGLSLALQQAVDVLNIDAHADLRPPAGRHSGNGFSYALKNGFLKNYAIFGLHQNYNNTAILDLIAENPNIQAIFFDDLLKNNIPVVEQLQPLLKNLAPEIGLEIDLDCVENLLSSAFTPSGFNINDVRRIILSSGKKIAYMHLCEGAVMLQDGRQSAGTAKAIAYLITDFIKAQK